MATGLTAQPELHLALDASGTGLWTWDPCTRTATWTAVCLRLLGAADGDTPDLDAFLQRVHPDDRARLEQDLAACLRSRLAFSSEFRLVRPDGSVRWVAGTGSCTGAAASPAVLCGSLRDITEDRHTRQALQDSQERLRLAVEGSGTGLWTWDLASDAVTWSSESYRIHGIASGQFGGTGSDFFALVHPGDRSRVEQSVRTALAENRPYACEFRIVRPDGTAAWVANRGHARYDADGQATGMLGSIVDISATRQVELAMQAALEASGAGTFRWDIRTDALWWDEALDRLFGLPPGTRVHSLEEFVALVHPDDRGDVLARCERCRTVGANFEMEFRIVRPDGTERWLYDRGRTFRDHQGRPASMTGACVDVTHRKHTELALRRSEAFYRQALESLPGMTFTTTADGWWSFLSEQWQDHTGIPTSQLLGHSWPMALHPDDRPAAMACERAALDSGRPYQTEYRVRGTDGGYRWFQVRCHPILDPAGSIASWLGTAVDVHQLKRAQAALAESEQRLRRAQRAGGIGVWEWSSDTGMALWTEQTARLMGCQPPSLEAVDAEDWQRNIHPDDLASVQQGLEAAYATGRFDAEFRVRHADGSELWLESDAELVRNPATGATKLVGTVRDVSERRRAEDALRQADRLKDEFLATLAHELRNPMSALRTGLELLKLTGGGTPQQESTRRMMERQLAHLVRLVDDLLDVSRISQGKIEIRRAPVALAAVLAHGVESAQEQIRARRHRLTLDTEGVDGLVVHGDLTRLAQVVANLLGNAARYTPEGGHIQVAACRAGDAIEIAVVDNGIGIAPALQSQVFDLFVQVGSQWRPGLGGLGIGLSLVRRLVELHDGSVHVRSAGEGQGSTFVVRLPLAAPAEAPAQPPDTAAQARRAFVPTRVLVVEDDADAAEAMRLMLELAGHEVRVAADGEAALRSAREFRPGVTFLDVGLPGMSGLEVARRLKSDAGLGGGLLVALTGWGSEADRSRSADAGFDLHLTKPVDPARIDDVLAAWSGRAAATPR